MTKAQKAMKVRQATGAKVADAAKAIADADGDVAEAVRLILIRNQGSTGSPWKKVTLS